MYLWGLYSKTVSLISNPQHAILTPAHSQNCPDSQSMINKVRDFLAEQLCLFTSQSGSDLSSLRQRSRTSLSLDWSTY